MLYKDQKGLLMAIKAPMCNSQFYRKEETDT